MRVTEGDVPKAVDENMAVLDGSKGTDNGHGTRGYSEFRKLVEWFEMVVLLSGGGTFCAVE